MSAPASARAMPAAGGTIMLTGAAAGVEGLPHSAPFATGTVAVRPWVDRF